VPRTGMSRSHACVLVVLFVAGARGGPAAAQGPGDVAAEPGTAALLEQRVPEELAVEGVMLSRRGLVLHIEQVGTRLLVSLVDRSTSRVAASTTIDHISADPDAAVATATHVVADLAAEIAGRAAASQATEPIDDRGDRLRRDAAEQRFRREALGFGAEVSVYLVATPERFVAGASKRWFPFQGELKTRLEPVEFYRLVGRTDLVESYRRRHAMMIGLYWGGGALAIGSAVLGLAALDSEQGTFSRLQSAALVAFSGGLVAIAAGRWLQGAPQPISENEAKSLAEQYNLRLRRQLGLAAAAKARIRDVRIAPYVSARDAGVALATAF
jgi:hypothetical protein